MPEMESLNVRMRRVCMLLRQLRKDRGLTGPDVERMTGIPPSTLSRIETSERAIRRDDLSALLVIYGVSRAARDAILKLHADADQPSLLAENDLKVHNELATYVDFEQDATVIRNYQNFLVPGLAQTPAYAHAVISTFGLPLEPEEIERRVAARIARQTLLHRENRPAITLLLHEVALHQNIGGPGVMQEQLQHLESLIGRIDVRIVPNSIGGHPGLGGGPFVILDFQGLPGLVHIEHKVAALYLEDTQKVDTYKVAFNGILAVAHGVRESAEIIRRAAEGVR
jgi:transcriptional regulator with XRE-family HTH domain